MAIYYLIMILPVCIIYGHQRALAMNLFRYVFRAIEVRQPIEINIIIIGAKNMHIFFGFVVFFFFEYLRMPRQY
jgi:hypothetical protein